MKTWISYFWHYDKANVILTCIGLIIAFIFMSVAPNFDNRAGGFVTQMSLPFAAIIFCTLSQLMINALVRSEPLRLVPRLLAKARWSLVLLNSLTLIFLIISSYVYSLENLSITLLAWAVITLLFAFYFLRPTKLSIELTNFPLAAAFLIFILQPEIPSLHLAWSIPAILMIIGAYYLILKGNYRANTIGTSKRENMGRMGAIFEWLNSLPKSPKVQYRYFGLFGLYDTDLLLWQLISLLFIPLFVIAAWHGLSNFQNMAIAQLIFMSLLTAFIPLISGKQFGSKVSLWGLVPISNSRASFVASLINSYLKCHFKLLAPFYIFYLLTCFATGFYHLSLLLLLPLINVGLALGGWIWMILRWNELLYGLSIIVLLSIVSSVVPSGGMTINPWFLGTCILIAFFNWVLYKKARECTYQMDWS